MPDCTSPKQPAKLRTSCNRCGIAKVKCDRGQPECARCIAHDKPCVYGLSRKNGRPGRVSRRTSTHHHHHLLTGATQMDVLGLELFLGSVSDASPPPPHPLPPWSAMNVGASPLAFSDPSATSSLGGGAVGGGVGGGGGGLYCGGGGTIARPSSVVSKLGSFNINEWSSVSSSTGASNNNALLSIDPPDLAYLASSTTTTSSSGQPQPAAAAAAAAAGQPDGGSGLSALNHVPGPMASHFRDAHEILRSLSIRNPEELDFGDPFSPSKPAGASSSPSPSPSAPTSITKIPLDHVLCLAREAIARLEPLLAGPCAGSPDFVYLCASIISRILKWYDWAASRAGSTWTVHQSPPLPLFIQPARIALGIFAIDDPALQTTFEVQIILAEMKRLAHLIDHFIASGPDLHDVTRTLYETQGSHLRSIHSQIVERIKAKSTMSMSPFFNAVSL